MPIITKLSSQKRPGYFNIFLDEEFWCGLSDLQVATLDLHRGQEITQEFAESLREQSEASKAYNVALRFLSYRIRSRREVSDHLKRKEHAEHIDEVLERLESERYLNDEDFAERWASMRRAEGRSPHRIGSELLQKGIDREVIDRVLLDYADDERQQALIRLISKKQATGQPPEKITQSLQRQGWRYDEIKNAWETLSEE